MLVNLHRAAVHGHCHQLLSEGAARLRRHRALVRAQRQFVLLGAGDAVQPAEVLGGFQHPPGDGMTGAAGGYA